MKKRVITYTDRQIEDIPFTASAYSLQNICKFYNLNASSEEKKKKGKNVFPKQSGAFELTFLSNCCFPFKLANKEVMIAQHDFKDLKL